MEPADRLQQDLFWDSLREIDAKIQKRVLEQAEALNTSPFSESQIRILAFLIAKTAYQAMSDEVNKKTGGSDYTKELFINTTKNNYTSKVGPLYEELVQKLLEKREALIKKNMNVSEVLTETDT